MIQGLKAWLETFSGFKGRELHIDDLPERPGEYSLEINPERVKEKKYMRRGGSVRRCLFILASREITMEDAENNQENLDFYMEFADWLDEQNYSKNFPNIGETRQVLSIEATTNGYVAVSDAHGTARYQIQCQMRYHQKG